jgi:hypothetical protein
VHSPVHVRSYITIPSPPIHLIFVLYFVLDQNRLFNWHALDQGYEIKYRHRPFRDKFAEDPVFSAFESQTAGLVQRMATATMPQQFAVPSTHYGYTAPPSPPMDEASRCSLPSISNLLGLADQGSPTSEHFPAAQQQQQQQQQQTQGEDTFLLLSHFVPG